MRNTGVTHVTLNEVCSELRACSLQAVLNGTDPFWAKRTPEAY